MYNLCRWILHSFYRNFQNEFTRRISHSISRHVILCLDTTRYQIKKEEGRERRGNFLWRLVKINFSSVKVVYLTNEGPHIMLHRILYLSYLLFTNVLSYVCSRLWMYHKWYTFRDKIRKMFIIKYINHVVYPCNKEPKYVLFSLLNESTCVI